MTDPKMDLGAIPMLFAVVLAGVVWLVAYWIRHACDFGC